MDYFVSAEDTVYHHWQLELLIESFRFNGLADKLVVAIAQNDEEKTIDFTANLRNFGRIFVHDNIGRKRGYLPMNRPYSLIAALDQKVIQQPLTLIDPDMVMVSPVPVRKENVTFQVNPLFTTEAIEPHIPVRKHVREILTAKKLEDANVNYWIPIGSVMTFNDVPKEFFNRVVEWTEILEFTRKKTSQYQWWYTEKVAWALTLLEYHGHLSYNAVYNYEMSMLDNNVAHHFVHYNHGLTPAFNKHHCKYNNFAISNPFEALLENNPTSTTAYVQQIVQSYLKTVNK